MQKTLTVLQLSQKESAYRVGAKESIISEKINASLNNLLTLHENNMRDGLGASQEIDPMHHKLKVAKG